MVPYVYALVDLDEGPRLTTNIVGCPVDEVAVGMRVRARFEDVDDATAVVLFEPDRSRPLAGAGCRSGADR
jgi:uncharacterized OB-fold protein